MQRRAGAAASATAMLGWVNQSVEAFITDTFGVEAWLKVVEASGVHPNWVSSCPYSDKITYE